MSAIFRVPSDREPIIDPSTGLMSRSWFLFFQDLFKRVGGSTGTGNSAIDAALQQLQNEAAFSDSLSPSISILQSSISDTISQQIMSETPNFEVGRRLNDLDVMGAFSK